MGNIGMSELILIFLVALLVFGAKRLPEIARGLGQGIREFRSATRDISRELNIADVLNEPPARKAPAYTPPRKEVAAAPPATAAPPVAPVVTTPADDEPVRPQEPANPAPTILPPTSPETID